MHGILIEKKSCMHFVCILMKLWKLLNIDYQSPAGLLSKTFGPWSKCLENLRFVWHISNLKCERRLTVRWVPDWAVNFKMKLKIHTWDFDTSVLAIWYAGDHQGPMVYCEKNTFWSEVFWKSLLFFLYIWEKCFRDRPLISLLGSFNKNFSIEKYWV